MPLRTLREALNTMTPFQQLTQGVVIYAKVCLKSFCRCRVSAGWDAKEKNPVGISLQDRSHPSTPLTRRTPPARQPRPSFLQPLQGVIGGGANSLWIEGYWGTAAAPIVVTRAPGYTKTVDLQGVEVQNCTYMYFKDVIFKQVRSAGWRRLKSLPSRLRC
jgi:hypothetical protein